jgi:GNAT superfamily N-acetyltransferase
MRDRRACASSLREEPLFYRPAQIRVDLLFQRQGFGRAILRGLEARARELGYGTLRLDPTVKQVPAQLLYESSGYRDVGRETDRAGQGIILFEKKLA